MKESDKEVEQFIEKIMKETSLETPSFDFTSKIMAQVAVAEKSKVTVYKPLISKPVWYSISGIILALIAYSFFSGTTESEFDFNFKMPDLMPNIQFSDATSYAVLIVAMMLLIQIPILKNYFDKRFEV